MNKKWEISEVSTPEHIFNKINNEMAQPVGIILFGADCELKDDVLADLQASLLNIEVFHEAPQPIKNADFQSRLSEVTKGSLRHSKFYPQVTNGHELRKGSQELISIFVLDSVVSECHDFRFLLAQTLREIGTKTLVGIYIKAELPPDIWSSHMTIDPWGNYYTKRSCIMHLESHPPSIAEDGLGYLLTISEEEEKCKTEE